MKAVKLVIIFVVILAVVVGVLFLLNSDIHIFDTKEVSPVVVEQESAKMEENFANAEKWDWQLYKRVESSLIFNKDDMGDGYTALRYKLNKSSLDRVYDEMIAEFAKANCASAEIERYRIGLDSLMTRDAALKKENSSQVLYGTYALYKKALAISSNVGLAPGFSKASGSWNNFSGYKQRKLAERSAIKGNSYFSYIKNISDVNSALNALDGKLNAAYAAFKSNLAKQIIAAYRNADRSEANYVELLKVRGKYNSEFGANAELTNFVKDFKVDSE